MLLIVLSYFLQYPRDQFLKKEERRRLCRNGCGAEHTPNGKDTPGFMQYDFDTIEVERARGLKFLRLKRNERRMKQTSMSMLQSWRANCDVSLIVYDTDPVKLNPNDIARVAGYIVSYTTKGNVSYQDEKDSLAALIDNASTEYVGNDEGEIIRISRQILNSLMGTRIISKAEASCELLSLDLYWCTESFKHISMSSFAKLQKKDDAGKTNPILTYGKRQSDKHLSLNEFLVKKAKLKKHTLPEKGEEGRMRQRSHKQRSFIFHPTGMNGNPVYPVSSSYAKTTLLMHKPWTKNRKLTFETTPTMVYKEFYEFLKSDKCPVSVRLTHAVAKENYERGSRFPEAVNADVGKDISAEQFEDDADLLHYLEALKNVRDYKGLTSFYRGEDGQYDFSQQFSSMDPGNKDFDWLQTQKSNWEEEHQTKHFSVNTRTGQTYSIKDLNDNVQQAEIVYTVMCKLREWIEFPQNHASNNRLAFNPLLMTIQGAGGTGKSHVIHIITNAVEKLFSVKVTRTCAPTGCAAYNIGGKTCHSFFNVSVNDASKKMSATKKAEFEQNVLRLLMIIIDERSLLSTDVLGASENNCRNHAHGGVNKKKHWGGIPIVLVFGDDYQLPSIVQKKKGFGATRVFGDNGEINCNLSSIQCAGRDAFIHLAGHVKRLDKSERIKTGDKQLLELSETVRYTDGMTEVQAHEFLLLKINNPEMSEDKRQQLLHEAIWIFTTNAEMKEHNKKMMSHHVSRVNPLMNCGYFIRPSYNSSKAKGFASHFKYETRINAPIPLCRGARVSVNKNIWQEMGIYNGATGTVVDIRWKPGESPLTGHLPLYVIVDLDEYIGPTWDKNHKTHVPIPLFDVPCDREANCCTMQSVPLDLSFARTLHKFQGKTVGPDHPVKYMVFEPGTSTFEGNNPGLLYTGLSRATTLGNGNINESALYLTGTNANEDRFCNLVHYRQKHKKNEKYIAIRRRDNWLNFLEEKRRGTHFHVSEEIRIDMDNWLNTKHEISMEELDDIITYHNTYS